MTPGFDLWAVIAEYRDLRASVLRLWRATEVWHEGDDAIVLMQLGVQMPAMD